MLRHAPGDGLSCRANRLCNWRTLDNPVHVRDFSATLLHTLGIHHEKLTYRFGGLDQRLTGVLPARVVKELLM